MGILSVNLTGANAGRMQSGGGDIDLTISKTVAVAKSMTAVKFQVSNLMDGKEGTARIAIVNHGLWSNDEKLRRVSEEIFEGEKNLNFGGSEISGKDNRAHAGWDGKTITLNQEYADITDNDSFAQSLGLTVKENSIITHNQAKGNTAYDEAGVNWKTGQPLIS